MAELKDGLSLGVLTDLRGQRRHPGLLDRPRTDRTARAETGEHRAGPPAGGSVSHGAGDPAWARVVLRSCEYDGPCEVLAVKHRYGGRQRVHSIQVRFTQDGKTYTPWCSESEIDLL